jgi:serine/threonine protein kinase
LFEEKKKYSTLKTKCFLGVYRYNDYIIRIDDSPYSFMNEKDVVNALSLSSSRNNIVLPFLVYTNIKRDIKNNICDCNKIVCACQYMDAADQHENMSEISETARSYFYKLRINTISFSIQHYVKNTEQLYNWIKDNIGNYVYNQFSNIQYPFFIDLFLKCSMLVRDLHEANIVHGDIKPDNILIKEHDDFDLNHHKKCKNFTVYLIDYGLSGIKNDGYGTGGTIPYCHPEFKNIRDINRSSKYNWKSQQLKHDVWSLGIIFITLYIYRDFYNYYYKYPNYFFTKDGYVSSLILDVISHNKLHDLFTKMLSAECSSIDEVCELLKEMVIH